MSVLIQHTFETLALRDSNRIDHLVHLKYILYRNHFLHVVLGPVHLKAHHNCTHEHRTVTHYLFSYSPPINLDFHDVRLFLLQALDQTQLHTEGER